MLRPLRTRAKAPRPKANHAGETRPMTTTLVKTVKRPQPGSQHDISRTHCPQPARVGDGCPGPRAREQGPDRSRLEPAGPLQPAVHSPTAADATGIAGDHAAHSVVDFARVHHQ